MNDVIIIEFVDIDPTERGISPEDFASLADALKSAIQLAHFDKSPALTLHLVAAERGSLKLAFKVMQRKFLKDPLTETGKGLAVLVGAATVTGTAAKALAGAYHALVGSMLFHGYAAPEAPATNASPEIIAIVQSGKSAPENARHAASNFCVTVLKLGAGSVVFRVPDCPSVRIEMPSYRGPGLLASRPKARIANNRLDHEHRFTGLLQIHAPFSDVMIDGSKKVDAALGTIEALTIDESGDEQTEPVTVVVVWRSTLEMPGPDAPPVSVTGVILSAHEAGTRGIITVGDVPVEYVAADGVFVVTGRAAFR
jgi:hypothetical protein